ncbi:MAG: hypothetical protein LBC41_06460 [Clostridiales bacterium]|nr:hypothetical protein [Clostridiales bacterium]MDR2750284.1 hypothetical protein [Clostridiales bacterium]
MQALSPKPVPGGTLTFAKCAFESPYGPIKSEWAKQENTLFRQIRQRS